MQDAWSPGIPTRQFRIKTLAPVALALLLSVLPMMALFARPSSPIVVSELDIKSSTFGSGTLYVGDSGIKWDVPRQHFYYAAYAPTWDLMLYNTKNHLGKKTPYIQWKTFESPRDPIKIKSMSSKHGVFLGLAARRVTMQVEPLDSFTAKTEFMYRDAQERSRVITGMEILESAWINLKPEQLQFVRYISGNPRVQGIVLKQDNLYNNGKHESILDTLALRNGKVLPELWAYPVTFKYASPSRIREEKERGIEAAEMLGTFMLDKPPESADTTSSAPAKSARAAVTAGKSIKKTSH